MCVGGWGGGTIFFSVCIGCVCVCVCVCVGVWLVGVGVGGYFTPENANFDFEIGSFSLFSWKLGMKSVSSDGAGDCRITAELLAVYTHIPVHTLQCLGELSMGGRGGGGGGDAATSGSQLIYRKVCLIWATCTLGTSLQRCRKVG